MDKPVIEISNDLKEWKAYCKKKQMPEVIKTLRGEE